MAKRDVIVMGASAGGVEALQKVIAGLPSELAATVLVVLHVPAQARSALPSILARAGRLRVAHPERTRELEHGTVLIAPPDHHLTLRADRIHLTRGPRINGHRPAVDPLFLTAARTAGPRVIGVVLSGALDDGAAGMAAIKLAGGATLVQDPSDALYPSMPKSVLEQIEVDHVLPAAELPRAIMDLVGREVADVEERDEMPKSPDEELETELVAPGDPGKPASGLTCPECHGALWRTKESEPVERYRCRVGHAYTAKGLFAGQSEALEEAIWTAYRALQESASLSLRLAARARKQNLTKVVEQYEQRHSDALQRADVIRQVLERGRLDAGAPDNAEEA
jgi:two-component system chemotaxis response regulator CheB